MVNKTRSLVSRDCHVAMKNSKNESFGSYVEREKKETYYKKAIKLWGDGVSERRMSETISDHLY